MGPAEHDRAGGPHALDDLGVFAGGLAVGVRAVRGDVDGDVGVVLDRHGHTEQRALVAALESRRRLVGLRQRALAVHAAERVELRVQPVDALEVGLDQLARRDLAGPDQLGLSRDSGEGQLGGVHGAAA